MGFRSDGHEVGLGWAVTNWLFHLSNDNYL